jgi:hypothetical protein
MTSSTTFSHGKPDVPSGSGPIKHVTPFFLVPILPIYKSERKQSPSLALQVLFYQETAQPSTRRLFGRPDPEFVLPLKSFIWPYQNEAARQKRVLGKPKQILI